MHDPKKCMTPRNARKQETADLTKATLAPEDEDEEEDEDD
jgi:hypothetical protein